MHIRSRLVKYLATGTDPNSGERVSWDVWLRPNVKGDLHNWRTMAAVGGFTNVMLKRDETDSNPNKSDNPVTLDKAEIAREGLKLLDALIEARRAKA